MPVCSLRDALVPTWSHSLRVNEPVIILLSLQGCLETVPATLMCLDIFPLSALFLCTEPDWLHNQTCSQAPLNIPYRPKGATLSTWPGISEAQWTRNLPLALSVSQSAFWSLDRSAIFSPGMGIFPLSAHVGAKHLALVTVRLCYIMLNPTKGTLEPITSYTCS